MTALSDADSFNKLSARGSLCCVAAKCNLSALHQIEAVCEFKCGMHILLHQHDGNSFIHQFAHEREKLLHDHGCQPFGRLVDQ